MRDENLPYALSVRNWFGDRREAEGGERVSTSLSLRHPTPRLRMAGHLSMCCISER
jgi:hypothetical protein